MMDVSYVEDGSFRVSGEFRFGCRGRRLVARRYVIKDNPGVGPADDITHTLAAEWALAGGPADCVFHIGSFWRLTDITGADD